MSRLRRFGAFWYDFVIGDDWRLAVGVLLGIGIADLLVRAGHASSGWVLPVAVVVTLAVSLRRATRRP